MGSGAITWMTVCIIILIISVAGKSADISLKLQLPIMGAVGLSLIALAAGVLTGGFDEPDLYDAHWRGLHRTQLSGGLGGRQGGQHHHRRQGRHPGSLCRRWLPRAVSRRFCGVRKSVCSSRNRGGEVFPINTSRPSTLTSGAIRPSSLRLL